MNKIKCLPLRYVDPLSHIVSHNFDVNVEGLHLKLSTSFSTICLSTADQQSCLLCPCTVTAIIKKNVRSVQNKPKFDSITTVRSTTCWFINMYENMVK